MLILANTLKEKADQILQAVKRCQLPSFEQRRSADRLAFAFRTAEKR